MSISTEISRLNAAKNKLKAKGVELGISTNVDKLDVIATAFDGITNQGAVQATVQEGATYTIPAGYHNGSGTVSGVAGGGNYGLQSKSVTPAKKQQNITPDSGYYGLSDVTVGAIPDQFQDVSSVTAGKDDVLANKIIVNSAGEIITGVMPNNGAVSKTLTADLLNYTIPKGYHNGLGTIKIVTESQTITPTKETQDIVPNTGKLISKVTVNPIPDKFQDITVVTASEDDVLASKTFINSRGEVVTGTIKMMDKANVILTPEYNVYNPNGYYPGDGVVGVYPTELTVTPTKEKQEYSLAFYHPVTVNPIPAEYITTTDATAVASDILSGKTAYKNGVKLTGTMANNGATGAEIDGLTVTSYTIPAGYTSGGTVSLTSAIEEALAAI